MLHFISVLIPYINLLNLSWIIKCLFLRNMDPLIHGNIFMKLHTHSKLGETVCLDQQTTLALLILESLPCVAGDFSQSMAILFVFVFLFVCFCCIFFLLLFFFFFPFFNVKVLSSDQIVSQIVFVFHHHKKKKKKLYGIHMD